MRGDRLFFFFFGIAAAVSVGLLIWGFVLMAQAGVGMAKCDELGMLAAEDPWGGIVCVDGIRP